MKSASEIAEIVDSIEYKDWKFEVIADPEQPIFIRVHFKAIDPTYGNESSHSGRKWVVDSKSTESEIVQTCLLAVLIAEEHEAREQFKFCGKPVFNPHHDVRWLRENSSKVDEREALFPYDQ